MKRLVKLPGSRARTRADVDAELQFHLEGRIEELMAGGLSREAATQEAHRRFGDAVQHPPAAARSSAARGISSIQPRLR